MSLLGTSVTVDHAAPVNRSGPVTTVGAEPKPCWPNRGVASVGRVVSSTEPEAVATAEILAAHRRRR